MMLYNLHEMNRVTMTPLTYASSLVAETFSNPFSPYSYIPGSRRIAARFDIMNRLNKEYKKPEWMIDEIEINGKAVSVKPEVIDSKPFCNLVHFQRSASKNPEGDPSVLIVAPISGHHATLLRDTVKRMLTDFDVYITDWVDARNVPVNQGAFDLDENVQYVISSLQTINKPAHVVAVCQPCAPVFAAVSLMSQRNDPFVPLSMTLMGGPIDTDKSPTIVNNLADQHPLAWFESQMIQRVPLRYPGGGRLVYPGFMQLMGFLAMNPRNHTKSYYEYYLDLMRGNEPEAEKHRSFYDEYNAVCDLPAEFYLQTVKVIFQDNALVKGTWKIDGHLIDPSAITSTALLVVEGELDDITGIGQTSAAIDLATNIPPEKKKSFIAEGSGHYGIFSGTRWRTKIFPVVADFIYEAQKDEEVQLLARLRADVEEAIRKENEAKARIAAHKKQQSSDSSNIVSDVSETPAEVAAPESTEAQVEAVSPDIVEAQTESVAPESTEAQAESTAPEATATETSVQASLDGIAESTTNSATPATTTSSATPASTTRTTTKRTTSKRVTNKRAGTRYGRR